MTEVSSDAAVPVPKPVPAGVKKRLAILLAVATVLVGADQISKQWALDALSRARTGRVAPACTVDHVLSRVRKDPVVLIPERVSFEYTENCGGAFGLLGRTNESVRYPFFVGVSILAIVFIVSVYRKLEPQQRLLKWALPMVLGGALGNFYDRLVYRYVVDFIKVQVTETWAWPTFNVADAAITAGVVLMVLDMIVSPRRRPAPAPSPAPAAPEAGAGGDPPAHGP